MKYLLPLYLIQGGVFVFAIIFQEMRIKKLKGEDIGRLNDYIDEISYIIIIGNQVMTAIMVAIMVRVAMFTGKSFF